MRSDHLSEADLATFTQQVREEQARARRIQQIDRDQTGSVRQESKRKRVRKMQKAARKKNR